MKHLNRKEYKETIKRFRDSYPLARVQNHWVFMRDEMHSRVLMYVDSSVVKRVNDKSHWKRKEHCFDFEGQKFVLRLQGSPTLKYTWRGLEELAYGIDYVYVNKDCEYKILNDDEVVKYYEIILHSFDLHMKEYYTPEFKKNRDE